MYTMSYMYINSIILLIYMYMYMYMYVHNACVCALTCALHYRVGSISAVCYALICRGITGYYIALVASRMSLSDVYSRYKSVHVQSNSCGLYIYMYFYCGKLDISCTHTEKSYNMYR